MTSKVRLARKQMGKGLRYHHMLWSVVIGHVPLWLDDDRVCYQGRVWGACCLALAVPGPDRGSWAAAQGSHYSCGVRALALLHTAALGLLHQLPHTVQLSLWKDMAKERTRGGWEGFLPRILKDGHDTVLWKVIMLHTTFTSHLNLVWCWTGSTQWGHLTFSANNNCLPRCC